MKLSREFAFASASLLTLIAATPAAAQGAQPGDDSALGEPAGEIVVTARRREEDAQDVPLVVNAVTSESLSKLNIRDFRDVQNVVPGLQLNPAPNGSQANASIRGVFNDITAAGNNPSVQFYYNDAPINLPTLLTAMFDVGQIEVLRGPQGTLRGRAAPSGSITVTTRRPDMQEIGGYINMTGTTRNTINVNGAVGIPIVRDVLAIRIAGLYDESDSTLIRSINNGIKPFSRTHGQRVSLRFDPLDTLTINASFTNVVRDARDFQQVESASIVDPSQPASPVFIRAGDRLAAGVIAQPLHQHFKTWNWSADWRFAGQRLVYVGSDATSELTSFAPNDAGNAFAGRPDIVRFSGQQTNSLSTAQSHELRLQSDERIFGMFDYIIGGFIYKTEPNTNLVTQTPVFCGAFCPPGSGAVSGFIVSNTPVTRSSDALERSVFVNLTAHLGERTEVSAGGRYINYKSNNYTIIPAAGINRNDPLNDDQWIYTASIKHRFNENFMAYASIGSSWRPGSTTNAVINTNLAPSPREAALLLPQPSETSTSYEIGFKSDFFDRRVRLNVSAFHQDFDNFIFFAPNIWVANTTTTGSGPRLLSGLGTGVPAKVDGVEAEIAFKASSRFNLSATIAYAKSKIKNGVIPCNNFPTPPTSNAVITGANNGETVGACTVNFSASRSAPFSATLQGEYMAPFSPSLDGFIRGLVTVNGNSEGDPTNPYDQVDAFAIVNLYTGIRSPNGAWEVSAFVKNLFDVERVLTRNASVIAPSINFGRTGVNQVTTYRGITTTAPREFGLNVRYAFGSR